MALIAPEWLPLLVTGTAMLALAAWLLYLDWRNAANRLFAAFLTARALTFVLPSLAGASFDPAAPQYTVYHLLMPAVVIPLVPIVLYFLSVYPERRGPLGRWRAGGWVTLAIVVALEAWYFLQPSAYGTVAPGSPATAGAGYRFTAFGPLSLLSALRLPILALAALVLARDYWRQPRGSTGFSNFLMFAGFGWAALYDAVNTAGNLGTILRIGDVFPWGFWGTLFIVLPTLTAPLVIVALLYIVRAQRHEQADKTLQEPRRFILYAAPVAVALAALSHLPGVREALGGNQFLIGLNRMVLPFLVTYALFRFSLFDSDVRMKAGVRRAVLLVAFAITFFVISESAEALLLAGRPAWYGLAAAVLLALAIRPVQALAERAADMIMPDTVPLAEMGPGQRYRMYRDQWVLVERDGHVTPKERQMLDRLAGALGFDADVQATIEGGGRPVIDATPPAPRPQQTQGRAWRSLAAATLTVMVFAAVSTLLELLVPLSDFGTALVTSAGIALLLGPFEALVSKMTSGGPPPTPQVNLDLYLQALDDALADLDLSRRDRNFLEGLGEFLGIPEPERQALDVQALRRRGMQVPWNLALRTRFRGLAAAGPSRGRPA